MSINQIDISNQIISMNNGYVTRKGEKVRILCTDNYTNPEFPVVAIVGDGDIGSFTKNGLYIDTGSPCDSDLIDIWTYKNSQLKQGDILIVGVFEYTLNHMRVFSHFDVYGHCCCFDSGMQSGDVIIWDHYRKATEEEIARAFLAFHSAPKVV